MPRQTDDIRGEASAPQGDSFVIYNLHNGWQKKVWTFGQEAYTLLIDNDTDATETEHMLFAHNNAHAIALLTDQTTTNTTKEFSISFWVNFKATDASSGTGNYRIIDIRSSDGGIRISTLTSSGYLKFDIGGTGGTTGASTSTTGIAASGNLNKWWQITCVCFKDTDDSNKTKTKVYINGVLEHTSSQIDTGGGHSGADSLGGLIVGASWDSDGTPPSSGTRGLAGLISDLAIWNVALTTFDAVSLYNKGVNIILTHIPPTKLIYIKRNNLLAYWRMGKAGDSAAARKNNPHQRTGSTVTEQINGYHGTMIEGTSHAKTGDTYDNASVGAEADVQIVISNGVDSAGVLADGCTIKLTDTAGKSITLEIDEAGNGVAAGNVVVDASALGAAASLAGTAIAIRTVIAAQKSAGNIAITATNPESTHIKLVQDVGGSAGNTQIVMTVTGSNARIRPDNDATYGDLDAQYPSGVGATAAAGGADSFTIWFGHGENGFGASNPGSTEARSGNAYIGDDFFTRTGKYSGTTAFAILREEGLVPIEIVPKRLFAAIKGVATIRGRTSSYKVSSGTGGSPSRENLEN